MFDFAWSEIALIGVVALIFIGPKDMPIAIKAVTGAVKKARRMAAEFQTHVDDMVKDTELHDIKQSVNEIRNFDWKGHIERAVDDDGSLRSSMTSPFVPDTTIHAPAPEPSVPETAAFHAPASEHAEPPAFVPPHTEPAPAPAPVAPAFIPPEAAHRA